MHFTSSLLLLTKVLRRRECVKCELGFVFEDVLALNLALPDQTKVSKDLSACHPLCLKTATPDAVYKPK